MERLIRNDRMAAGISTVGGELRSLCLDGVEYLWQGDPDYWPGRAPNIFPYVARLTDGQYTYAGQTYHMDIHGFLKDAVMDVEEAAEGRLLLALHENAETLAQYPFRFALRIGYELRGTVLHILYSVENTDDKTMYFGLGGHPGFFVPLEEGLAFPDYELRFARPCRPLRVGMSAECFATGTDAPYPLAGERSIPLDHSLFNDDAIILRDMDSMVELVSSRGDHAVRVQYPDMRYLGLWHAPRTDASYVCIEPWTSLPSREGVVEDIAKQGDLISLDPGKTYTNNWSIALR